MYVWLYIYLDISFVGELSNPDRSVILTQLKTLKHLSIKDLFSDDDKDKICRKIKKQNKHIEIEI